MHGVQNIRYIAHLVNDVISTLARMMENVSFVGRMAR